MDDFLREINVICFKRWILIQKIGKAKITEAEDSLLIETEYGKATINFYNHSILEFIVFNNLAKDYEFYLHFQMNSFNHTLGLYNEMINTLLSLKEKAYTKVLLSCSSGMTTGYFSEKLNKAIKLLGLKLEIGAVNTTNLYKIGEDYDIILLAPQVSYLKTQVQEVLKNKVVMVLPVQIFARYDINETLEIIKEAQGRLHSQNDVSQDLPILQRINNQKIILCLSLYKNVRNVHIKYRIYDKNSQITANNEIIKPTVNLRDIFDTIDTILLRYPKIAIISLAVPGINYHGELTSTIIDDIPDNNVVGELERRYDKQIILNNDVNAAVMGYYATQNKYQSIVMIYQPITRLAGAGAIINGKLVKGRSNLAGEVQFLPLELSAGRYDLAVSTEGTIELVSKMVTSYLVLLDPEVIVLASALITDLELLRKEVAKFVEEKFIPEIIKIEDLEKYILAGEFVLSCQTA